MEAAMRGIRFAILVLLIGFCGTAEVVGADAAADAWKALRAGGHVALMRHADAPGGVGDPPGFRLDDCATQRNLSEKGRADAAKIGARLKLEGIAFEQVLSSPWCRCIDTAMLLNLGTVETEVTFTSDPGSASSIGQAASSSRMLLAISSWRTSITH